MTFFWLQIFTINLALVLRFCGCNTIEEELTLTLQERLAIDEFKMEISHVLPHDYMHEDIYLIKWLRAKNLQIENAKAMLINNLKWRADNNIDTILDEDFSQFVDRYPFWLDGRDKDGRPVGSADISVWDPSAAVISGKAENLYRYAVSVLEFASRQVRKDQADGKNVTQYTLLANLDGFNVIQHACIGCIPFYIRFLVLYEDNYPGMLHKLFMINTPPAFELLLRIARPVLSKMTTDAWSIHGTNKRQWMTAIRELIEPDQIRNQFGGTKQDFEF